MHPAGSGPWLQYGRLSKVRMRKGKSNVKPLWATSTRTSFGLGAWARSQLCRVGPSSLMRQHVQEYNSKKRKKSNTADIVQRMSWLYQIFGRWGWWTMSLVMPVMRVVRGGTCLSPMCSRVAMPWPVAGL